MPRTTRAPDERRTPTGSAGGRTSAPGPASAAADHARRRAAGAVGYCRRSTDRQEQSIPDQQRAIERHCREQGLSLLRWHVDDAISGTKATNRPAFQQMVAEAQKPSCDFAYVVVYDVKRFGRLDNDEAGYYRHMLKTAGVEVLYVAEGFGGLAGGFGGTDTDDLLRPVKQWQARQESKDLSKVTIRGLLSKVEGGWWMGGSPPYGYDLRYETDRGEFLFTVRFMPDCGKQVLDDEGRLTRTLDRGESISISKRDRARLTLSSKDRVATIKSIFRLYTEENRGLKAIADWLNRSEIPTPRGPAWSHIYAGVWSDSTIRAILVNPLYAGDMVWNRRSDGRFHKIAGGRAVERRSAHGARLEPNDPADWITVRDAHPALVPRRTWDLAQRVRQGKPASAGQLGEPKEKDAGPSGGWTGMRARFLLSGLVKCGRCGASYQGVTRTKGKARLDGTKVKSRYYACGGYIARGRSACEFGAIGQEALEQQVIEEVIAFYRERYLGPGGMERLSQAVRDHLGHEAADVAAARKRLERDLAEVESTIASLLDNMTEATRDLAEERLAALRKKREALRARSDELDRVAMNESEVQELVHDLAAFLAGLEVTLRGGVNEQRQAALRRCVERVVVGEGRGEGVRVEVRMLPLRSPMAR